LKKKVKNKKYQYTKGLYEKLLNWKETDPKQYWQVLKPNTEGDDNTIQYNILIPIRVPQGTITNIHS
jgi:hypothetical protein